MVALASTIITMSAATFHPFVVRLLMSGLYFVVFERSIIHRICRCSM